MDSLRDAGAGAWEFASQRAGFIAGQAAQLNADLVDLMVEVLETNCWSGGGIRSPEHWLQLMTTVSPAHAADIVAAARAGDPDANLAEGDLTPRAWVPAPVPQSVVRPRRGSLRKA